MVHDWITRPNEDTKGSCLLEYFSSTINLFSISLTIVGFEETAEPTKERHIRREVWQEPEHGKLATEDIRGTQTPSKTTDVGFISIIYGIANLLSLLFQPGNE